MNNAEQKAFFQQCLYTALLELLQEKEFERISVGALCERAGVSRMTYYRSYTSKEEILVQHLDESFARYWAELQADPSMDLYGMILTFFRYVGRTERAFYTCIVRRGLAYLLVEPFYEYLSRMLARLLPDSEQHPYIRSYLAGGLYKVTVDWTQSGMALPEEEMARLLVDIVELSAQVGRLWPGPAGA